MLGLVWVWRALVGCGGPETGVRAFKCVGGGLGWALKALVGIEGIGCFGMGWPRYEEPWMGEGVL